MIKTDINMTMNSIVYFFREVEELRNELRRYSIHDKSSSESVRIANERNEMDFMWTLSPPFGG